MNKILHLTALCITYITNTSVLLGMENEIQTHIPKLETKNLQEDAPLARPTKEKDSDLEQSHDMNQSNAQIEAIFYGINNPEDIEKMTKEENDIAIEAIKRDFDTL